MKTIETQDATIYPTNAAHKLVNGCTAIYKKEIVVVKRVFADGTCQVLRRDGTVENVKP